MNFERQPPRYVRVPPWELPPTNPNPLRGNPWFEECLRDSPFERDTSNSITDTRSDAELQRIKRPPSRQAVAGAVCEVSAIAIEGPPPADSDDYYNPRPAAGLS